MKAINRHGFTSISEGKAEKECANEGACFNIILVHGLRGHPQHTWESEIPERNSTVKRTGTFSLFKRVRSISRSTEIPKPDENGASQQQEHDRVYWPRDFLAADLPQTRVWTYGYNADVIGGLFQASNKNSITQHGRDLANKLEREIDNEDPIIFIAHSLGGIVTKDALHNSKICRKRTKLIIFLGTPHRGSGIADLGTTVTRIVEFGLQDPNKDLVRGLKVTSEILERVHLEFVNIVNKERIKIHSFQEGRAITGVKGFHDKIVDDFSSRFDLGKEIETTEHIDADHRRMAKYSRREDAGYRAVSGVIKKFLKEFDGSRDLPTAPLVMKVLGKPPVAFKVPFRRNQHFVGREDVLKKLSDALFDSKYHRRIALNGLGGVGKTQIALEFAYQHQQRFPRTAIYWVYASSRQQFESSYSIIAEAAQLPESHQPSSNKLIDVQKWLEDRDTRPWLLVLDNADDEDLFSKSSANDQAISTFLPQRGGCSILVTTRFKKVGFNLTAQEPLEVRTMERCEAKKLLHESLDERYHCGMSEALLESLDCLPLAISQATAFMIQNDINVSEYTELLTKEADGLLSEGYEDPRRGVDKSNAVLVTWALTFDSVWTHYPRAAEIFIQMSFYDRQGIPETLLYRPNEKSLEFKKAIGCLTGYSLIQTDRERRSYAMHRLVHEAIRYWVKKQGDMSERAVEALTALGNALPDVTNDKRHDCTSLMPHVRAILDAQQQFHSSLSRHGPRLEVERAALLTYAASYIDHFSPSQPGAPLQAARMIREALEIFERTYGKDSALTWNAVSVHLSLARSIPGEFSDEVVDGLLQRLSGLQRQEQNVVFRSRARMDMVRVLATRWDDRVDEARKLATLVVEELRSERTSDETLLNTLSEAYLFLGVIEFNRGEWWSAEAMFHGRVAICKETDGPDGQDVWSAYGWIVSCLLERGKLADAERLARQCAVAMVRKWGKHDKETLSSIEKLNLVLEARGKAPETVDGILEV